jgi:SAM-dependent methyltransferase
VARVILRLCPPGAPEQPTPDPNALPLAASLERLHGLRIYELQAQGPLHELLRGLPGYVCSEYYPNIPPGERGKNGVLCQDATRLTFDDDSFDLIISQDVLEHIEDPWRAFREMQRALRPGGLHVFTVPLREGAPTRPRTTRDKAGFLEHILPKFFHKDPLDPDGALVFWDYGDDLPRLLTDMGIPTRVALRNAFYPPEQLCRVDDEHDHAAFLSAWQNKAHAAFFLYNSVVFVNRKS